MTPKMKLTALSASKQKSHSFIDTCRTGDIEQVRLRLPALNYKEINRTDNDGNTGLHLACKQDNYDLVQLLLQSDRGKVFCSRTILNKHGLNAYECTQSDRVRSLFARPSSTENRFVDTNYDANVYQAKQVSHTKSDRYETEIPNNWNHGYPNPENAIDAQFLLAISRAPWLLRKFFRLRTEPEACKIVRNIIRRTTKNNKTYEGLMKEFNLFIQTKNAEHLLTLYTKEMEFCKILQMDNNAFTTLLYLHLNSLVDKTFDNGETFRGIAFTDFTQYQATIKDYRWAKQNDDYVLETRALQSTSKDRLVADMYIDSCRQQPQQTIFSIIFHYQFSNKCFTAFDLDKVSNYPGEQEVLILPFTLFKVTNIEEISPHNYIITLMNVSTPQTSISKAKKKMKK